VAAAFAALLAGNALVDLPAGAHRERECPQIRVLVTGDGLGAKPVVGVAISELEIVGSSGDGLAAADWAFGEKHGDFLVKRTRGFLRGCPRAAFVISIYWLVTPEL
jgi:hypothetical protein